MSGTVYAPAALTDLLDKALDENRPLSSSERVKVLRWMENLVAWNVEKAAKLDVDALHLIIAAIAGGITAE